MMPSSRMESVVLSLRDLILSGDLEWGTKITEVGMAERLGVSRTPVRLALQVLESEGLVTSEHNRGFTVKRVTEQDVLAGFDVRGCLEGLACRIVTEAGMRRGVEAALGKCVDRGDFVCAQPLLNEEAAQNWAGVNREFHRIIIEAAENAALAAAHDLVCRNPLVGPGSMALSSSRFEEASATIPNSQRQHRVIWEAMRDGQSARAEFLAREHIHTAKEGTARHMRLMAGTDAMSEKYAISN